MHDIRPERLGAVDIPAADRGCVFRLLELQEECGAQQALAAAPSGEQPISSRLRQGVHGRSIWPCSRSDSITPRGLLTIRTVRTPIAGWCLLYATTEQSRPKGWSLSHERFSS
jgi:hypothetical protein